MCVPLYCRWVLWPSVFERGVDNPDLIHCKKRVHLLTDVLIALHMWNRHITAWFVHAPHLWEVRIGRAMELALAPHLATTRSHPHRDPVSDVIVHVQYDAFRDALGERKVGGEPIPELRRVKFFKIRGAPAYQYKVFENGCDAAWYRTLTAQLGGPMRPQFFAIDDDLLDPNPEAVERHRGWLTSFFQSTWGTPVEWEVGVASRGGEVTPKG